MAAMSRKRKKGIIKWSFILVTLGLYAMLYVKDPARAYHALGISLRVLLQISIPILIAFTLRVLINMYVTPEGMRQLLSRGIGIKGIVFSSLAGLLSMGPVFAWYPLLKDFREKGVPDLYLANFLTSRAVKPFLFPVMVYYFGLAFSLVLNLMILLFSPLVALITSFFTGKDT